MAYSCQTTNKKSVLQKQISGMYWAQGDAMRCFPVAKTQSSLLSWLTLVTVVNIEFLICIGL